MSDTVTISRRDFLRIGAAVGGGLLLGFSLPSRTEAGAAASSGKTFVPNAFIRIGSDETVTIIVNHSEMGQGVYTSLPMLVAEELECDWKKVRIEPAPVDPAYNHTAFGIQMTGGSTSIWSEWDRLRTAGAVARTMLIAAAARMWKVSPASCRARRGFVVHAPTGRRFSYGTLAEPAAGMTPPQKAALKDPKNFRLIGRPAKRLDTPDKAAGRAVFGIDVTIPGMLTAVIARPPVFGGTVKSLDSEKAKAVRGVKEVVQIPSGVAVVAADFWSALQGRDALAIAWNEGSGAGVSTEALRAEYAETAKTPGLAAKKEGDPEQALAKAATVLRAEYEVPYLAHAPMETLNCVVDLRDDRCELWTGTQFQTADRDAAARIAGLKPEQVMLHTTLLGGGFGRRATPSSDFVSEAVHVAKAVKKPVKVVWTREDDIKGGYYRPLWYDRIAAGIDKKGALVAWHHTIVGQSIAAGTPFEQGMVKNGIDGTSVEGAHDMPYPVPAILVDLHSPRLGVPVLWWRSVGHSHTGFVVESFIDEAAHAAGKDPFEFRRALLGKHPRLKGVLELAAQKAGWGAPLPKGRGLGIAAVESFGSFIAQVAEASVSPAGEIRVHRVVCAVDCGRTVNPDTIEAQMESAIVFGLSAALHGAITLKDGRVEQSNFHDYPLLRMDEMPKVVVHIVRSKEKPGGIGEPGVPPIAPAVANAVFAATGARVRRLPMRPEVVKAAMKQT
ncbi:MAG: xanthine dehydrogenase family protein molybdopterin-binding subunit [Nitrospirota bacterium]